MPKPISKEQQVLILAIIVGIILLLAYYSLLFKPKLLSFSGAGGAISKLKDALRLAQSDIANIENFKKELTIRQEKMAISKGRLSDERKIPDLLEELSGLAVSNNVKILRIEPQIEGATPAGVQPSYSKASISVNAKAGFHALGEFLSRLESANRLMKIADIEIHSDPQNVNEHDIRLLVDVFVTKGNRN